MESLLEVNAWSLEELGAKVAEDVPEGWLVNVGIGMPQIAVAPLTARGVILHSENGIIGLGPPPLTSEEDDDLIDAGKGYATILPGGSFIDSVTSFSLIRSGRLDLALMGAYQVSAEGDLANWRLKGKKIAGIGGAADLAFGAQRVWIITTLFANDGASKMVPSCQHPLTAPKVVSRIYTEYGIFEPAGNKFSIIELANGVDEEMLLQRGVPLN